MNYQEQAAPYWKDQNYNSTLISAYDEKNNYRIDLVNSSITGKNNFWLRFNENCEIPTKYYIPLDRNDLYILMLTHLSNDDKGFYFKISELIKHWENKILEVED